MDRAIAEEGERLFARAASAIGTGETRSALGWLERALKLVDNPSWYSYLGYCLARERGQVKKGLELCRISLQAEPAKPVHLLNMARVHLAAGDRQEALAALRQGMALGGDEEILAQLNEIGTRKPSIFPSLSRNHPLNRYLGLLCARLGIR